MSLPLSSAPGVDCDFRRARQALASVLSLLERSSLDGVDERLLSCSCYPCPGFEWYKLHCHLPSYSRSATPAPHPVGSLRAIRARVFSVSTPSILARISEACAADAYVAGMFGSRQMSTPVQSWFWETQRVLAHSSGLREWTMSIPFTDHGRVTTARSKWSTG